jgi:hypothetical protein
MDEISLEVSMRVKMVLLDENKKNITKENVELGGILAFKINEIINKQNKDRTRSFVLAFVSISVWLDLFIIALCYSEWISFGFFKVAPFIISTMIFLLFIFYDFCIARKTKKERVLKIEENINEYLENCGLQKTVKIMDSFLVTHSNFAHRF